jgi:hypothetical protein
MCTGSHRMTALQFIFSHLQEQTWATGLNTQRTGGRGREVCIITKHPGESIAQLIIIGGSGEVVITVISGQGKQVHVAWTVIWSWVFTAPSFGSVSCTPPCKHVIDQSRPTWSPGRHSRLSRGRDAKLLLLLVNPWAQVRGQCLPGKAVLKYLLQKHSKSFLLAF